MANDLAQRLEKRQRTKVPPRTAIVGDQVANAVQVAPDTRESPSSHSDSPESVDNAPLLPEEDFKNFELEQATLRIEKNISRRMREFCQDNRAETKISREALIEAMFLQVESDSALKQTVIDSAISRSELRKRAGNFKRGKSISERA